MFHSTFFNQVTICKENKPICLQIVTFAKNVDKKVGKYGVLATY